MHPSVNFNSGSRARVTVGVHASACGTLKRELQRGTLKRELQLEHAPPCADNVCMADDEHLSIMRQGADAWNAWRRLNPAIKPDLTGMSLSGKQAGNLRLAHADLS